MSKNRTKTSISEIRERGDIQIAKNVVAWQEKRAQKKMKNKTTPREYINSAG